MKECKKCELEGRMDGRMKGGIAVKFCGRSNGGQKLKF